MIRTVLIFNDFGDERLAKFFKPYTEIQRVEIKREAFKIVSSKPDQTEAIKIGSGLFGDDECKLVSSRFGTLYLVFCIDSTLCEKKVHDSIKVMIEIMNDMFDKACELDILFHLDKVNQILNKFISEGKLLDVKEVKLEKTKGEEILKKDEVKEVKKEDEEKMKKEDQQEVIKVDETKKDEIKLCESKKQEITTPITTTTTTTSNLKDERKVSDKWNQSDKNEDNLGKVLLVNETIKVTKKSVEIVNKDEVLEVHKEDTNKEKEVMENNNQTNFKEPKLCEVKTC